MVKAVILGYFAFASNTLAASMALCFGSIGAETWGVWTVTASLVACMGAGVLVALHSIRNA